MGQTKFETSKLLIQKCKFNVLVNKQSKQKKTIRDRRSPNVNPNELFSLLKGSHKQQTNQNRLIKHFCFIKIIENHPKSRFKYSINPKSFHWSQDGNSTIAIKATTANYLDQNNQRPGASHNLWHSQHVKKHRKTKFECLNSKPTQIERHKKAETIEQQILEQSDQQRVDLHRDLGHQKSDLLSVED